MSVPDTIRICAVAILAVFCFSLVRRVNTGFDMPLKLTAAVSFFGMVLAFSVPLFTYISELISNSELNRWQGIIFGALGIALMSHITAELCRECGEGSIGGYIELAGKVEILLLCLPLVNELLAEVENLVG